MKSANLIVLIVADARLHNSPIVVRNIFTWLGACLPVWLSWRCESHVQESSAPVLQFLATTYITPDVTNACTMAVSRLAGTPERGATIMTATIITIMVLTAMMMTIMVLTAPMMTIMVLTALVMTIMVLTAMMMTIMVLTALMMTIMVLTALMMTISRGTSAAQKERSGIGSEEPS